MILSDYRRRVDALKAEHELLSRQIKEEQTRLAVLKQDGEDLDKARRLIQQAALKTQEALKIRLTAIVTTALRGIFAEKDLEFEVRFVSQAGRTEAVLEVGEEGLYTNTLEGHGGGVADVVSFALRAAFWAISRSRPVLILDEPFRFLSRDLQPLAAEMIRLISDKLELQVIMVSHVEEARETADQFIVIERSGTESIIMG